MKCPVCNATFEPTIEEIRKSQPWGVKLCSEQCWKKAHKGQSPAEHRWEYHVGERIPCPEPGKATGRVDHSRYGGYHKPHRIPTSVGEALADIFK